MSRSLFRWGGLAWLTLCVTLRCHGKALFSYTPDPPLSVLRHPLAADSPAHRCPISFLFFVLHSLTLAVTVLWSGSVLGRPAPRWPTLWGRRWWTGRFATGCGSQQGTELHEHFLLMHFNFCMRFDPELIFTIFTQFVLIVRLWFYFYRYYFLNSVFFLYVCLRSFSLFYSLLLICQGFFFRLNVTTSFSTDNIEVSSDLFKLPRSGKNHKLTTWRSIIPDKFVLIISILSVPGSRAGWATEPGPDWTSGRPLLAVFCQTRSSICGWCLE